MEPSWKLFITDVGGQLCNTQVKAAKRFNQRLSILELKCSRWFAGVEYRFYRREGCDKWFVGYVADDVFMKCGEVPKKHHKVAVQFLNSHMKFSHSTLLGFCQHSFLACSGVREVLVAGLEVGGVSMFSLPCIYAHLVVFQRALCSSDVFVLLSIRFVKLRFFVQRC